MSCSTRRKNKPYIHQDEHNTLNPIPNDHAQTTHQTSEFRRTRRSRNRNNSRCSKAKPINENDEFKYSNDLQTEVVDIVNNGKGVDKFDGLIINDATENKDFDSDLNSDDVIEKGSVSNPSLDTNVLLKTEVVSAEDNGGEEKDDALIINDETENENEDDDDPVKRLEELRTSFKEVELSEEMMNINNQLQEDELLALEYIYGDNIVILENQNGLRCFQVQIHVEVPDGISISTNINSFDFSYSFRVEYLSPIHLTCLLPKSYPSNCAPLFTVSVQWLNSSKISDLCHKLDSIWQNQSGQEVIYPWIESLHDCTLAHLGLESEIVLGPYGLKGEKDRRAISGSVSPDIDIPSIKSYNDEQYHENFCRDIQECCICYSEYPGSEFLRLPCQHFFCIKCMKTFSDMHITEGTVLKIHCPESKCQGMIPPGLLKRLIGDEEFERWESLMLQKSLASMNDVVYCPRCETACLEDEDGDHQAQCSNCYYNFCTLCREKRHVGVACMNPEEKLLILKERQNSTSVNDVQKRREADLINQLLSMKEVLRTAKLCPSCKMAITKSEGCNKMACHNCGKFFCYRCNNAISGYEHFRDGKCKLFEGDEIQRWEAQMNNRNDPFRRQAIAHVQGQMFGRKIHFCPLCKHDNLKVGNNNHVFCWTCQNHYCYLCRKIVRRGSQHFRPNGCKQHTPG